MLRAAWLGSWKAPWGLDRGRRWGDPAWALAAIAQAWLLGGRDGRWPLLASAARRPRGPWVEACPDQFRPRPDPTWVALLRHGSARVDPGVRGPREDEVQAWAWEALLAGDGDPWMAGGGLLLDRAQRLRWVALLGAVDEGGGLHLPPFLEVVPAALRHLPPGWWETLLRSMDAEGRLLPEGPLDPVLPWPALQTHGADLNLPELPEALRPFQAAPWLHPLADGTWALDPRLRAWTRGWGAGPDGLAPLLPPSLGLGCPPEPALEDLLRHRPGAVPAGWADSVTADLAEAPERPAVPPASGHPTWDRLRMRWGGTPAPPSPGYPAWGTEASPCADPFHWMAQGLLFQRDYQLEPALRAFTLAHAHFRRLGARDWEARAASNAATTALLWADLPAHRRWAALRGPLPSPWRELEEAQLAEVLGPPEASLSLLRDLLAARPDFAPAWGLLASHGVDWERWDLVREGLPHVQGHPYARFLAAVLGPLTDPPPADADPETRISWETHRLLRGTGSPDAFWSAWEACPTQVMRLELGLQVLERLPGQRRAGTLLALQAIADRARSPRHQQRLAALWPEPAPEPEAEPRRLLEAWLAARSSPTWIAWEEGGRLHHLGAGTAPPEGALGHLARQGSLPPFQQAGWVWRGTPLHWDGAPLGGLLHAQAPDAPPDSLAEAPLLAPWLARLRSAAVPATSPTGGLLLTDGSEPMATVLRELDRVAASELPVLILGPTGSGKELAARELHTRSGRQGALVAVNCSAFAEGLLESELFGHVKGAFTGADRDRQGAIEAARGGTLFLDEVADLSPRLQSLLLRVLQEREVRRVGSDRAVRVDVRFAAATHRPLEDLAAAGSFRRDLLFRLQGAVLHLPPLAERRHEFEVLLPPLVARAAASARRPVPALAPGLARALARLPWPGNVRELLHALERAVLRCEGPILAAPHFPELATPRPEQRTWEEATRAFQRRLLLETLRTCRFRAADAAEALGLARPALYATAKRLGVDLVAERHHPESGP